MRVALIFPPYRHKIFSENLKVIDEEFCHAPPIILAYVASIIRQAGHDVILLDAKTLGLSKEGALRILRDFRPDLLGFRAETYYFHDALEWMRYLKSNLNIPVLAGGLNLSLFPRETLSHSEIDYAIIGEASESLPKLMKILEEGLDIGDEPGIAYKKDREIIINPPSGKAFEFDSFPFPARDLLPNEKYSSFLSKRKNFTIMVTSRGCPYKCNFCAIHKAVDYQERSAISVVDEINQCYVRYGIREIDFFDGTFFINKKRFFEISSMLKRENVKIEWTCRSRVDVIDNEILKEASSVGCRQIFLGIESGNNDTLDRIRKGINIEQVRQAVELCRKYKVMTMGFFMIGNPGETRESVEETIRFAKELRVDFAQFCRTIAKPGTNLEEGLRQDLGLDYWREYIAGKIKEQRLPTPWTSLAADEEELLTQKAYISFYFRFSYIIRTLFRIKSFNEAVRYIYTAVKMLFCNRKEHDHKR